jgi:hypothetical protein
MSNSFQIPGRAYDGLLDLIEIGPEKLKQLTKEVAERSLTLDTSELTEKLASTIQFPAERVERAIFVVLIPLNSLRAAFRMPPNEFLDLLAKLIARQKPEWHNAHGDAWKQVAPVVEPLLTPNGYFALLSKTFRLLANRPIVAREFKILTELRPVYDDELSATKAMVLTSTLVVDYEEAGEPKRLHLTVDQSDLRAIREQLDRANRKVQLLEEQAGRLGVPVLVAGTE